MAGSPNRRSKFKPFINLCARHGETLLFVLTTILPQIVRDRRRPVLFSRYTGMGDIICTIPAALELMKRHAGATFLYNCHPDFADVPRLAGVADRTTSLKHIGLVGYWYGFLLAGFYHFSHGDDLPGQVAREPMIVEFCHQFHTLVTDQHPQLTVSPAVLQRARRLFEERNLDPSALVLIHPGPSWTVKEWPRESWVRLVAELRAAGHTHIAQLGVARYMNFGQVAVENIPGTVSLVDALSIEECIAVISLARLFVGIDSGLLHIAACTRTPSVGLFGPTFPQFFYPVEFREGFVVADVECAGCYHRLPRLHWITGCPYDIKCMKTLGVNDVLRACLAKLSPPVLR
ncbi:MAG: glycosyltransferase family 9 protein [Chthoniobacter sp.]|uniref:glycosyltransferase family 9 protein n=1 Tax=Chthoniobacter sp. TaxID=2510640 RepID=UPI0032A99BB3